MNTELTASAWENGARARPCHSDAGATLTELRDETRLMAQRYQMLTCEIVNNKPAHWLGYHQNVSSHYSKKGQKEQNKKVHYKCKKAQNANPLNTEKMKA